MFMKKGKAENSGEMQNASNKEKKDAATQAADSDDSFNSELRQPCWSVVSFEQLVAKSLTYEEAVRKIDELEKQRVSGLCLITDEAAERISGL
jgi:hypothetical protein